MKFTTTIEFKSTDTNYRHEVSDEKRNTVRIVTKEEENEMLALIINIKYIRIVCTDGIRYFERELTDITRFTHNDTIMYIFSW